MAAVIGREQARHNAGAGRHRPADIRMAHPSQPRRSSRTRSACHVAVDDEGADPVERARRVGERLADLREPAADTRDTAADQREIDAELCGCGAQDA